MLARLADPLLMRFLPHVPHQNDEWAANLVDRLVTRCGDGTPELWRICLGHEEAPSLTSRLDGRGLELQELLRDPADRDRSLDIVTLALLREGQRMMAPSGDVVLHAHDLLLLAGRPRARAALNVTMKEATTATYVIDGRRVPSSWVWRRLAR